MLRGTGGVFAGCFWLQGHWIWRCILAGRIKGTMQNPRRLERWKNWRGKMRLMWKQHHLHPNQVKMHVPVEKYVFFFIYIYGIICHIYIRTVILDAVCVWLIKYLPQIENTHWRHRNSGAGTFVSGISPYFVWLVISGGPSFAQEIDRSPLKGVACRSSFWGKVTYFICA